MTTATKAAGSPRRNKQPQSMAKPGQYLTFTLADEFYAIELLKTKDIVAYEALSGLVSPPAFIRGVIELHGNAVPVLDITSRFEQNPSLITKHTRVIVVETSHNPIDQSDTLAHVGIIADAVNEVITITDDMIEPMPSFGGTIRPDFIISLAKWKNSLIFILSVDAILSISEKMAFLGNQSMPTSEFK